MAKQQAAVLETKPGLITRIKDFYQEVMAEMSKVTWPTKEELKSNTQVVLLVLAIMSVIIYVFDIVFQFLVVGLFKLM